MGALGITSDLPDRGAYDPDTHDQLGAYTTKPPVQQTYYSTVNSSPFHDDDMSLSTGSYLVQTSVVPVPAAVWLFGSGLIGLIGFARRKTNA